MHTHSDILVVMFASTKDHQSLSLPALTFIMELTLICSCVVGDWAFLQAAGPSNKHISICQPPPQSLAQIVVIHSTLFEVNRDTSRKDSLTTT